MAPDFFDLENETIPLTGDKQVLETLLQTKVSKRMLRRLFGGIAGSQIKIGQDGRNVDVWTSHEWFESPLYFSIERDTLGIILTINDFFLVEKAPMTLGTRIMAAMIFQAAKIPGFHSIAASATRFYIPESGELSKEVIGYYFFPRIGFNADPKNADDYVEIPEGIKGKKLSYIMCDPELRRWWKGNGQTIDVKFKVGSQKSMNALKAYLIERGIHAEKPLG